MNSGKTERQWVQLAIWVRDNIEAINEKGIDAAALAASSRLARDPFTRLFGQTVTPSQLQEAISLAASYGWIVDHTKRES